MALLKNWNLTLAEELAFGPAVGGDYNEKLKFRLDRVRKLLDQAADGAIRLPGAVETDTGTGSAVIISGPAPVCTRDQMQGW